MEPSTSSQARVPEKVAQKAAGVLKQYMEKKNSDNNQLFDSNGETVLVKFGLTEIPASGREKPHRIELPHAMWAGQDVCVFVRDDLSDRGKKEYEKKGKVWKKLVKDAGIPEVKKVISLQKLKREYKQYEQKRELSKAFDLFLCDKSIVEVMPRELGKSFENARKKPVPVFISKEHPGRDIQKAIQATFLSLPKGPDCSVRIGRCSMDANQIAENLGQVVRSALVHFRRLGIDVRSIHLTATDCISLPLWQRELGEKEVIVKNNLLEKRKQSDNESDEEDEEKTKEPTKKPATLPLLKKKRRKIAKS